MTHYFNISPSYDGVFPAGPDSISSSFQSAPTRQYVSNSERIMYCVAEDRDPLDSAGQLVSPVYDSEDVIKTGAPNPFTNPAMSELDRFEYATSIGLDILAAREVSGVGASVQGSTDDPTATAAATDGSAPAE